MAFRAFKFLVRAGQHKLRSVMIEICRGPEGVLVVTQRAVCSKCTLMRISVTGRASSIQTQVRTRALLEQGVRCKFCLVTRCALKSGVLFLKHESG